MRRQLLPAISMILALTVVCGLAYPLVVTGVLQVGASNRADGSLVRVDGRAVGSSLIGQSFTGAGHFWGRPSAAGPDGYDAMASSPSNLGPTNPELLKLVSERVAEYRAANDLADSTPVPVDAVTASGSGLDPHISMANARLQVNRVARATGLSPAALRRLIDAHVDARPLGVLGEAGVNVLELNIAVDAAARR